MSATRTWTAFAERAEPALREDVRKIPGVNFSRNGDLVATEDVADAVAKIVGEEARFRSATNPKPMDISALPDKAFPWQRDGAIAMARGDKFGLFHACGMGKAGAILMALRLLRPRRALILTRAMGRMVYARDSVWAWPGVTTSVLVGRSADDSVGTKAQLRAAERYADRLRNQGANVIVTRRLDEALEASVLVTGYETLPARIASLPEFDVVVADESHLIKGYRSDRTIAAHGIKSSVRRIATATPVPDRIRDLWAQWAFADKKSAGSAWVWRKRYAAMKEGRFGGMDDSGLSHADELRARVASLFDVRTRADIMHVLPPARNEIIRIPNDDDFYPNHSSVEDALAYAADRKLEAIASRVCEALIGNEKVAVVGNRHAWVPKMVQAIEKGLGHHHARRRLWMRTLTGAVGVSERLALAAEFVAAPAPAVAICTLDSIKVSIDMQDADRVIAAALPWTGGDVIQFKGRFQRPGQVRPVSFDWTVCEGTIDEEVEELVLSKLEAIETVGAGTDTEAFVSTDRETAESLSAWLRESYEKNREAAG